MNNHLKDKGWQTMLEKLDIEMPIRKERNYPIIFMVFLTIIGAGLALYVLSDSRSNSLRIKQHPFMADTYLDDSPQDNGINTSSTNHIDVDRIGFDNPDGVSLSNKTSRAITVLTGDNATSDPISPTSLEQFRKSGKETFHSQKESIAGNLNLEYGNFVLQEIPILSSVDLSKDEFNTRSIAIPYIPTLKGLPTSTSEKFKSIGQSMRLATGKELAVLKSLSLAPSQWSLYTIGGVSQSAMYSYGAGVGYRIFQINRHLLQATTGLQMHHIHKTTGFDLVSAKDAGIAPDRFLGTPSSVDPEALVTFSTMTEVHLGVQYQYFITKSLFLTSCMSGIYRNHNNNDDFSRVFAQSTSTTNSYDNIDVKNFDKLYSHSDIRLHIGLGYKLNSTWALSGMYNYGFRAINKYPLGKEDNLYYRMWQFKVEYNF